MVNLKSSRLKNITLSAAAKLLQLIPTRCNLRNCSQAGSSVHGILWARIPEWIAMPYSMGSS